MRHEHLRPAHCREALLHIWFGQQTCWLPPHAQFERWPASVAGLQVRPALQVVAQLAGVGVVEVDLDAVGHARVTAAEGGGGDEGFGLGEARYSLHTVSSLCDDRCCLIRDDRVDRK